MHRIQQHPSYSSTYVISRVAAPGVMHPGSSYCTEGWEKEGPADWVTQARLGGPATQYGSCEFNRGQDGNGASLHPGQTKAPSGCRYGPHGPCGVHRDYRQLDHRLVTDSLRQSSADRTPGHSGPGIPRCAGQEVSHLPPRSPDTHASLSLS